MRIKHNTAIINDIIIEQNVKQFDPRWIARGCFCESTRTWIMNIPKNASNSIGRLIAPGNRPRPGWQTEKSYSQYGTPEDRFIVVLRNPVARFAGSLVQHYAIGLEHKQTLQEINAEIDSLNWIKDGFDDMHLWPQFTYLHGLPTNRCEFVTMDQLTDIPHMVGLDTEIPEWNITSDNEAKQGLKRRIEAIITTNPDVNKHIKSYYETDTLFIENFLGYIPQK
jgi:hypothetical protein